MPAQRQVLREAVRVDSESSQLEAVSQRFRGLDGLRALAVLMVISHNYGSFPGLARGGRFSWFTAGYVGVTLFFVLSGFLITQRLIAEYRTTGSVSLVSFWKRRAFRLLPALFLCLLLLVVENIRTHINAAETLRALVSAVFYVFNLVSAQRNPANPLGGEGWGALWSLSVEEQFYVLWPAPLLWAWRRAKPRTTLLGIGLLSAASAAWCTVLWLRHATFARLYLATDTRAQSLFLGAGLAVAWHSFPQIRVHTKRVSGLLGPACALLVLAGIFGSNAKPTNSPGWMIGPGLFPVSVLCGFIVLAATEVSTKSPMSRLLNTKVAVAVGQRSYGLYLFHVVSAAYFRNVQGGWLLSFAVTFALAWASYALLEQPVMRWSSARAQSRKTAAAGVGVAAAPAAVVPPAARKGTL
jgi:peptidoglycan/LPS O-acetylase OafA/YrhL